MQETIFFEIPIYRCDLDSHNKEMEKDLDKKLKVGYDEKHRQSLSNYFYLSERYDWNYNEIIGFLNLYFLGSQFRIDFWFLKNRRINQGIIKKQFIYRGKALEKQLPQYKSSIEIFDFMIFELKKLNKTVRYKKSTFDLGKFEVIGPFVEWTNAIHKLNPFN